MPFRTASLGDSAESKSLTCDKPSLPTRVLHCSYCIISHKRMQVSYDAKVGFYGQTPRTNRTSFRGGACSPIPLAAGVKAGTVCFYVHLWLDEWM